MNIENIHTVHGLFNVDIVRDRKIGERLKNGEYHQKETLQLLQHFITPESNVVDIGAHIGTLAIPLAKIAKKVIAFEPTPETFELLKKNIEQNDSTVEARNKGLGASIAKASIEIKNTSNAGANTLTMGEGNIEIGLLDSEIEHADLIKIDVEGMELSVLEGGKSILKKSQPIIFSEINLSALREHASSSRKIEYFLRTCGYQLFLPLIDKKDNQLLGTIHSLTLVTACIAPRAWAFGSSSAPFDIIAIPAHKEIPLPVVSATQTLQYLVTDNLSKKIKRFIK